MTIEIRHYTLKPNQRKAFITFFEAENRPALRDAGMLVFGPLRDLDDESKVHWLRAFPSMEEPEKIKAGFYYEPVWNTKIEHLVVPMIAQYEAEVVETTAGLEGFGGKPKL